MIEFILTEPDNLPFEALNYLNKAIEKTPGNNSSLWEILEKARKNEGSIIVIKSDKIQGALYLELFPDLLNIILLAGDNINSWKDDLTKYLLKIAKEHGINHGCVIGRQGWHKIFTNMTPIGMLYVIGGVQDKR